MSVNPGESPADAIVRHLSGVRAKELWVVANDLRYEMYGTVPIWHIDCLIPKSTAL